MNNADIAIVWFRQDLRLADNPALHHAATEHQHIMPLYILDETMPWPPTGAQLWWLHHSLSALQKQFKKHDVTLILKRGDAEKILLDLCKEQSISAIYWNRCYEPAVIARDTRIKKNLTARGTNVHSYNGSLLYEPWEISNNQGSPFKVFTPFWKKCISQFNFINPLPTPQNIKQHSNIESENLNDWKLLPTQPNWASGFRERWQPGEQDAQQRLTDFISEPIMHYTAARDFPAQHATSELSAHLHFGEISPRQIWNALKAAEAHHPHLSTACEHFLRQLFWREFSYHLLYHFPDFPEKNFQKKFDDFPWVYNKQQLVCWQKGQTGYPIIDAGLRELWHSGYMHNRVRMIAASFLTKHLLMDWRIGAAWFWDTLVDADLANNSMGWQWVAGSGVDAAPYYRIFNPILQSKKFDTEGNYIRHWVPELSNLSNDHIHEPWKAPEKILENAGIILGKTYPKPIVEHDAARARALDSYKNLSRTP